MDLDELVRAVLDGERRAWTELGRRLLNDLERFFARSLGEADARDLAQITVMIVARKLPEFRIEDGRPFRNWVRAIARVQLKEAYRQERRRARLLDELGERGPIGPSPSPNLSSRLDRAARRELVARKLVELDSPYRRVVEHDLAEGDVVEFCRKEQIKPGSLRTRRHRAHAQLRHLVHQTPDSTRRTPCR